MENTNIVYVLADFHSKKYLHCAYKTREAAEDAQEQIEYYHDQMTIIILHDLDKNPFPSRVKIYDK